MSLFWIVVGFLLLLIVLALLAVLVAVQRFLLHQVRHQRDRAEAAAHEARAELGALGVAYGQLIDEVREAEAVLQNLFPDSISKDFS
jgi:hypothetical protein